MTNHYRPAVDSRRFARPARHRNRSVAPACLALLVVLLGTAWAQVPAAAPAPAATEYSAPPRPSALTFLMSIIPILLLTIPLVIITAIVARRKGRNAVGWAFLALIPWVNLYAVYWLATQTDASVLHDIEELKRRLPS